MTSALRFSFIAGIVSLALPMLAGASAPPSQTFQYPSICGNYIGFLTFEFHQNATSAWVVTTADVHKNPFALAAPDPRWASVYSESATRPTPSAPWATNTEQHDASFSFPEPAVTTQTANMPTNQKACELKGRAIISVGCPGNATFYADETVNWPGCGN